MSFLVFCLLFFGQESSVIGHWSLVKQGIGHRPAQVIGLRRSLGRRLAQVIGHFS
jgi:hypothetical protein